MELLSGVGEEGAKVVSPKSLCVVGRELGELVAKRPVGEGDEVRQDQEVLFVGDVPRRYRRLLDLLSRCAGLGALESGTRVHAGHCVWVRGGRFGTRRVVKEG